MMISKRILLAATAACFVSVPAFADEIKVVASIKPIHSLVAGVMKGVAEPTLLVDGAQSPHDFQLKPSQAASLEKADIVFWVGHELESFLEKPVEAYHLDERSVELFEAKGVKHLAYREGVLFDHDDHGHEEHDAHDDHAKHDDHDDHEKHDDHAKHDAHDDHDKHDDHAKHDDHDDHDKHDDHAKHDDHDDHDAHDGHEGHNHGTEDAHIWLDPANGKALVAAIEHALSKADPAHHEQYEANAEALIKALDALEHEVEHDLENVQGKPFIVFHDAYHYFEHRFEVEAAGAITVNPETRPSAARVAEVRELLKKSGAVCVFAEPQFEPKIIASLIDGTDVKRGILDPLGAELENGPELYPALIRSMANSLKDCLS